MIIFKKLRVKNFLSFGNAFTEVDLQNSKVSLITGSNGAGKSSLIVEGLTFALYGQAYRDIKKSQLINFVNNNDSVVELEFSIDNNEYKIVRGQKPNILQLFKNNDLVPEAASSKDFQQYIEGEVLRMNLVSFKQLVVLGTANFIPFMQLSVPQRRKLVDDLLDVSIFTLMDQLNKGSIKELNQQMQENTIKLQSAKSELHAYKLLLQEQKNVVFSNVEIIESELIEKKLKAQKLRTEINSIKEKIENLDSLIKQDNVLVTVEKLEQAKTILNSKIQSSKLRITEANHLDTCPSCQQKIEDTRKQVVIQSINQEISNDEEKINSIEEKLSSLESDLNNFRERQKFLQEYSSELSQLSVEFSLVIDDIKKLNSQLEQSKTDKTFDDSKVKELESLIELLETNQQNWFNEKYCRTVLSTLLVDSGIKATVIKKFVPVINKKINQYLKILGADYLFLLDQEFNEQIKGSGREKASYYSFSQGEKARVDLALMFTWRDIASIVSGTSINVLVLDEVFDSSTDNQGIDGIRKIIDSLDSNVFIISHREQNSDDYNRHIEIQKQGRFSQVKETQNGE